MERILTHFCWLWSLGEERITMVGFPQVAPVSHCIARLQVFLDHLSGNFSLISYLYEMLKFL